MKTTPALRTAALAHTCPTCKAAEFVRCTSGIGYPTSVHGPRVALAREAAEVAARNARFAARYATA